MTEERKEIVEILLANRLYLYSLLHKCFGREPDRAQLELLASEQTAEGFAILGGEVLEKVPAFFAELREDLKDPSFPEQVKAEYNRFFIGPGDLTAPPWESIYLGNEGALFQKTTLEVRQAYRAFGLQPESYRRVPDDSLALELAFLGTLAERARGGTPTREGMLGNGMRGIFKTSRSSSETRGSRSLPFLFQRRCPARMGP